MGGGVQIHGPEITNFILKVHQCQFKGATMTFNEGVESLATRHLCNSCAVFVKRKSIPICTVSKHDLQRFFCA